MFEGVRVMAKKSFQGNSVKILRVFGIKKKLAGQSCEEVRDKMSKSDT